MHVLERIGDPIKEQELKQFFNLVDSGGDFTNMDEILDLLMPQTTKDLYSKSIPTNVRELKEEDF